MSAMAQTGLAAQTAAMVASDSPALLGGVSRPSRKACTRMRGAPPSAAIRTIAAICRSWLSTPPGDTRPRDDGASVGHGRIGEMASERRANVGNPSDTLSFYLRPCAVFGF